MSKQPKRHYDTEQLVAEYTITFGVALKAAGVLMGVVLVYFLVFVVYLGGRGHEPYAPFYHQFKDRFQIEYPGTKLPEQPVPNPS